jgi:dipeptidase
MSYAVYIGRERSDDECAYLAGYGDEPSSHWLEVVPHVHHGEDATIEVGVTPEAATPGVRATIPQAPETFRHLRVSYSHFLGVPPPLTNGGLNEHGVAVRDVWSPSSERLTAMTPENQTGPNYSDLARLVLERARSAREGVDLVGALIAEHGYSTYGGNSHLIADDDEAWVVIEFAGGQGLWVAERLGADAVRVSRPGYVLEVPTDFVDRPDFAGAPHLIDFAVTQGWYEPDDGPFDANAVYGDGKGRWPGVAWIEEELAARAESPEKLGLADVMWAVRTERLTGDSAGYGQVVPLVPTDDPDLRLLWHAPIGPIAAPFTPFFLGVESIPSEFGQHRYLTVGEAERFVDDRAAEDAASSVVPQRVEATRSAIATYKRLLYLLAEHHETFLPEVTPVWEALELRLADDTARLARAARLLIEVGERDLAGQLLTRFCATEAGAALDAAEAMVASMDARSRIRFGIRQDLGWRGPDQLW